MRHVIITFVSFLMSYGAAFASNTEAASNRAFSYSNAVIFVENGITFSVFPDGEFDFFIDNPSYLGASYRNNGVSISFNAGFDYNPWVQYDDYGAVVQIENTPVYYDFYGRVTRIGGINVYYNGPRISRVGGLYVYYNPYGAFSRFSGYINMYNRRFVYRPVFNYFVRPVAGYCLVNTRPYRRYYQPVRYTYYRPYRNNHRRAYATVGRNYHYKDNNPRRTVYHNDRRVVRRDDFRARKEVRDRSVKYVNTRGYNKQKAYRDSKNKRQYSRSNERNNAGYSAKRSPQVKKNKGYQKKGRANTRVSTTRTTTVNRPGKKVTKTTRVTKTTNPKVRKTGNSGKRASRSYSNANNGRKVSKPASRNYKESARATSPKRSAQARRGRKN